MDWYVVNALRVVFLDGLIKNWKVLETVKHMDVVALTHDFLLRIDGVVDLYQSTIAL